MSCTGKGNPNDSTTLGMVWSWARGWHYLVLLLCCLACAGDSGGGAARDAGQVASKLLYVVNESSRTTGEVQLATASVQRQLSGEFRTAYQVDATLALADPPTDGSYRVYLLDEYAGDPNAGYHDGQVTAFVATSQEGWSEILSHEAIEMLVGNVCDPVQAPYSIPPGSPVVENFLLPGGGDFLSTI